MNGTIIDIPGISVNIQPIDLEDSTDKAFILYISDGDKEVQISITYNKINSVNEKIRSSKHE